MRATADRAHLVNRAGGGVNSVGAVLRMLLIGAVAAGENACWCCWYAGMLCNAMVGWSARTTPDQPTDRRNDDALQTAD